MAELTKSYTENLFERLRDPAYAAEYINAALEEGDEAVLMTAIKDVVDATVGVMGLAERAELDRKSLYRTLSEVGNPRLSSLTAILRALGLKLRVQQGEAA